jgi:hypothetical protein
VTALRASINVGAVKASPALQPAQLNEKPVQML